MCSLAVRRHRIRSLAVRRCLIRSLPSKYCRRNIHICDYNVGRLKNRSFSSLSRCVSKHSDGVRLLTSHQCAGCGSQPPTDIQLTICWQHSHADLPSYCLGHPPSCRRRAQYATSSAHVGLMHNLFALCRSTPREVFRFLSLLWRSPRQPDLWSAQRKPGAVGIGRRKKLQCAIYNILEHRDCSRRHERLLPGYVAFMPHTIMLPC